MEDYIDLNTMSLEELAGVVNIYPWYAAARKELFKRVAGTGESVWSDVAMYLPDFSIASSLVISSDDCSDKDISDLVAQCVSAKVEDGDSRKKPHVPGGDYFSREEYEQVGRVQDSLISRFRETKNIAVSIPDFVQDTPTYTETMAAIYAEQGYLSQAKEIYSKLILAYPEKNAYFAALIEKLK